MNRIKNSHLLICSQLYTCILSFLDPLFYLKPRNIERKMINFGKENMIKFSMKRRSKILSY